MTQIPPKKILNTSLISKRILSLWDMNLGKSLMLLIISIYSINMPSNSLSKEMPLFVQSQLNKCERKDPMVFLPKIEIDLLMKI